MSADQLVSAVQDSSESVVDEKSAPDGARAESQTEIGRLKKKVDNLTLALQQQKSKVDEAEQEQIRVAVAAMRLRDGINEAASILTEEQQSNMPNNDDKTDEKLIEHLRKACSEMNENNESLRGENESLKKKLKKQEQLNNKNIDVYQQKSEELVECQQRETQLSHEIKTLKDQAARSEREQADREQAAREQITQFQRENQQLSEQLILERRTREQAARDQVADVQAQNDILTQENNTVRTQVDDLQNQQNQLRQQNITLEAQRRDQVGILLANLVAKQLQTNALINRHNEMREQRNDALRQLNIMREDNDDLAQALENTINQYEEEICFLLYQIAEMIGASWSEANDNSSRVSQPQDSPPLRWTRKRGERQLECVIIFI
jgi:myosin heavy subunit